MTEALIANLAKISALRVISRQSVMRFKSTDTPLPEIAEALNVDAIVEGSVLRSGDRIRITTQLIQASPEQHLWAESYERVLPDILTLQREVAHEIAQEIEATLTPRDDMLFRMLLGRTALKRRCIVDPSRSYLIGPKPAPTP